MKNIKFIKFILIFIILVTATHLVHRQIRGDLIDRPPDDILYLPEGEYAKIIALGFDNFMANILWLRALQYFGGHFMYDRQYPLIDRILDVIITLEPTFKDVYSFGAMVLFEEMGERDKAVDLLWRGIENNPDSWKLCYELGFIWFEEIRQSTDSTFIAYAANRAIEAYALATTRPNCPEFVHRIINQLHFEAGRKQLAREMWERTYIEAESDGNTLVMHIAQDKLFQMDFIEVVGPIRSIIADYYEKYGKIPERLSDLVREGYLTYIPRDPITGDELAYDNGWVYSRARPHF